MSTALGFRGSPVLVVLIALAFLAVIIGSVLFLAGRGGGEDHKTAAIVDQLSLSDPNPGFVSSVRRLLAEAAYLADYIPSEQVTVDFYRRLPTLGYDLIILRVHSGITVEVDVAAGERDRREYVSLFTGERYSEDRYPGEQLNRLGRAVYYEGADPLFGIGPDFVTDSMEGNFDGALIVMMGCDGLRSERTAQAFLDKGASAFVSWSKPVMAHHTDRTTERLLERLLIERLTTADAVAQTATEVGPDPVYHGELRVLTGGD